MASVEETWKKIEFITTVYREGKDLVYVLGDLDDIFTLLDETLA